MKLIPASFIIETPLRELQRQLLQIESAGRVCYKSEDRITETSHETFIKHLIGRHHESVLEHSSLTVHFTISRNTSHQLVRHRIASPSQESTRYCNYSKLKHGGEVGFIIPCTLEPDSKEFNIWSRACYASELHYLEMLEAGCQPEEASDALNHAVKTEVVLTANFREWRHILRERTAKAARPHMREVMVPLLSVLKDELPCTFGDL